MNTPGRKQARTHASTPREWGGMVLMTARVGTRPSFIIGETVDFIEMETKELVVKVNKVRGSKRVQIFIDYKDGRNGLYYLGEPRGIGDDMKIELRKIGIDL